MKKILFCASTTSHIKAFHIPYLKAFHDMGYEVWVAANIIEEIPYADKVIELPFYKSIISPQNIKAIFKAHSLLKREQFDIISLHTTLASAVMRAAILLLPKKPIVFNTIHGYLFNENDGFKKWIYLLPEIICRPVTHVIMVMNQEDYRIAKKYKLYKKRLYKIDGMGIDLKRFHPVYSDKSSSLRIKYGFAPNDFIFSCVGELSKMKNQQLLIHAFSVLSKRYDNLKLILAGKGPLMNQYKSIARELGISDKVLFLGYIKTIENLYTISDCIVTTSLKEGLPFNVLEAMACGVPIIASNIKGHTDLIENGISGLLFESQNESSLKQQMELIYNNPSLKKGFQQAELSKIRKYDLDIVFSEIMHIYRSNL